MFGQAKPDWPGVKFCMLFGLIVADTWLEHISYGTTGMMFAGETARAVMCPQTVPVCHLTAPRSSFSRCFNRDKKGVSAK